MDRHERGSRRCVLMAIKLSSITDCSPTKLVVNSPAPYPHQLLWIGSKKSPGIACGLLMNTIGG